MVKPRTMYDPMAGLHVLSVHAATRASLVRLRWDVTLPILQEAGPGACERRADGGEAGEPGGAAAGHGHVRDQRARDAGAEGGLRGGDGDEHS
eukprot:516414-Pyramimonas_sp.AAC.1